MKNTSAIHPAIMNNTEDSLVKCAPHILICESYNSLISAVLNSFHYNIAVRRGVRKTQNTKLRNDGIAE